MRKGAPVTGEKRAAPARPALPRNRSSHARCHETDCPTSTCIITHESACGGNPVTGEKRAAPARPALPQPIVARTTRSATKPIVARPHASSRKSIVARHAPSRIRAHAEAPPLTGGKRGEPLGPLCHNRSSHVDARTRSATKPIVARRCHTHSPPAPPVDPPAVQNVHVRSRDSKPMSAPCHEAGCSHPRPLSGTPLPTRRRPPSFKSGC